MTLLGVYTGPPSQATTEIPEFLKTTNMNQGIRTDFLQGAESGNKENLANCDWVLDYHIQNGDDLPLDLAIPLLPKGEALNGMTLDDVANGALDLTFSRLGTSFANRPELKIHARLGWEPNGLWYPWVANPPEVYVAAWRRAAAKIFLTPGTDHVKFTWCVSNGRYSILPNPLLAYPGNKFVDFWAVDFYDYHWMYSHDNITDYSKVNRDRVWNDLLNGQNGLQWWFDKAQTYGKPFAVCEWGVGIKTTGQGGGDNTDFINRFLDWTIKYNPEWVTYFNVDAPSFGVLHKLTGPNSKFPLSAQTFTSRMSAWPN